MKIKPQTAFILTVLIFAFGIGITSAAGLYQTKTDKNPGTIEVAGYTDQADPAGIRGSYTFGDVSRLYGIPLQDLSDAFGLDGDAASIKVSALKTLYDKASLEIGPPAVRLFVAYYLGLPHAAEESVLLPQTAATVLLNRENLSPEQRTYVEAHIAEG